MRFPYRAPRCEAELFSTPARWGYPLVTVHNCGLRAGHKSPHRCRKHTCRREW
jgi:hypothetical protein